MAMTIIICTVGPLLIALAVSLGYRAGVRKTTAKTPAIIRSVFGVPKVIRPPIPEPPPRIENSNELLRHCAKAHDDAYLTTYSGEKCGQCIHCFPNTPHLNIYECHRMPAAIFDKQGEVCYQLTTGDCPACEHFRAKR